jgi:hypothetical protein
MKKELDEILDLEFNEELDADDYYLETKDGAIIYFALKNYLGYLTANGASINRIRHCLDLAYEFKGSAKDYCTIVINRYNQTKEFDIKELDNDIENAELKTKLEN